MLMFHHSFVSEQESRYKYEMQDFAGDIARVRTCTGAAGQQESHKGERHGARAKHREIGKKG